MQPLREIFTTCNTALKFVNTLTKPPLKLSLSYYRPTTFLLHRINKPRMEEMGATIPKISHCEFCGARCVTTHVHFHCTLFSWACGSFREPRKFFKLSFYTFTCLSNNSLISSWISAKFVSALLLCMLYLSYYYQSEVNT